MGVQASCCQAYVSAIVENCNVAKDPMSSEAPLYYVEQEHGCKHLCKLAQAIDVASHPSTAAAVRVVQSVNRTGLTSSQLSTEKIVGLRNTLEKVGIDTSAWGGPNTKTLEHLCWEVYEQRGCLLRAGPDDACIKRVVQLVKVRLVATVRGVQHELVSRSQLLHDGQQLEREQAPLTKLRWISNNHPHGGERYDDERCIEKECPYTEDWRVGCKKVMSERLGLSEDWQRRHLEEQVHSYSYRTEEEDSLGYPGLRTLYCIHQIYVQVVDPEHPDVGCIGLPHASDFATMEGDFALFSQQVRDRIPIGARLNIWTWSRARELSSMSLLPSLLTTQSSKKQEPEDEPSLSSDLGPVVPVFTHTRKRLRLPTTAGPKGCQKRVPLPLIQAVHGKEADAPAPVICGHAPNAALCEALSGWEVDWANVERMATRIADPDYSLQAFHEDLLAFPELGLYLLEGQTVASYSKKETGSGERASSKSSSGLATSGRTVGDEYQRTLGAFFAIYWLFRLPTDGREGFSFGVDESWSPLRPENWDGERLFPSDKRLKFYEDSQWDYFEKLLGGAGLIDGKREDGTFKVNVKRVTALLALTAVHDIMKMEVLLPEVQQEHAPYHGYQAGDLIGDHDHALSYLMDFFPEILPSFSGLDADDRGSVQFTQCELCFNHGWFVQAEAPPGAVFSRLKEVVQRSSLKACDVAFYFVHWLTDLAGAEPTPLAGCEKFVTKFPLQVLNSFLWSFEYVQRVADSTETEVMQEYLEARWLEASSTLGPTPQSHGAIAQMRLMCMAQTNAAPILNAFSRLPQGDRDVLCEELARTGCRGQHFACEPVEGGPAVLVYYGPAFLQNLGSDDAVRRLAALAEVYRGTRALWPIQEKSASSHVTVRIDAIKALSVADIADDVQKGDQWLLVKRNHTEAFVERSSTQKLKTLHLGSSSMRVLDLV